MNRDKLSRRRFLKEAVGFAGGAAAFPYIVPSQVFGQDAPSGRITLGFIGTGKQSQHLIRSFLNSPGTQMLAACDVDKLKLKRAVDTAQEHYTKQTGSTYKGCAAYGDFRELLARDDIDAVVIATPDHWHAITVIEAAKAGKE